MKKHTFDDWIRNDFPEINTQLEEIYFATQELLVDDEATRRLKQDLLEQGREHIINILSTNDIPQDDDQMFYLLGDVGMYMAACRRHALTDELQSTGSPMTEAAALSTCLGTALNVAPRFMATHLSTHNLALNGRYRAFTLLDDEHIFLDYNTLGTIAYIKAANALQQVARFGVTHPLVKYLFCDAKEALAEVLKYNEVLDHQLDVKRFFYNVRPYYKPYRVGKREYRGANAGDFAGINEVDLLLGLCTVSDQVYLDIIADKVSYMPLSEQSRLRASIGQKSLLDQFLEQIEDSKQARNFSENIGLFLEVCEMHGKAYAFHHDQLVSKFIQVPATDVDDTNFEDLTASGPPLPVLLKSLERLRDLRLASERADIPSRYSDIRHLKSYLVD